MSSRVSRRRLASSFERQFPTRAPLFHIVKLADDIARRAACQARHFAQPFRPGPVAGGTGSPLPCAGLNQRLAFLNAAHGNVGDEAGVVVAEFGLLEDFRSFR